MLYGVRSWYSLAATRSMQLHLEVGLGSMPCADMSFYQLYLQVSTWTILESQHCTFPCSELPRCCIRLTENRVPFCHYPGCKLTLFFSFKNASRQTKACLLKLFCTIILKVPLKLFCSSHVLAKVCTYFMYKVRYTNSSTEIPEFPIAPEIALELLMAANFLDCWRNFCFKKSKNL